jgi:acylglycerol lipase
MGGGEAVTLASEPLYADLIPHIRGWLLESPFIDFTPEAKPSSVKEFVGRLASKILPMRQLYNPLPAENLTRDPEVVKSLLEDKLLHGTGTLEGLAGMIDRTALLCGGKTKLNKGVKSIWLGHGTADKGTSYAASKKWFDAQLDVEDKEFKSYEGWSHQLHADLPENRGIFAKDVGDWILTRSGSESKNGEAKL